MSSLISTNSHKEFLILLLEAHNNSGRSLREVTELCNIDHSYLALILKGVRSPHRDLLICLCWLGWNLDIYQADEILRAGGYKKSSRKVEIA